MCGISGLFSKSCNVNKAVLNTISCGIAHRGPDDEGLEIIPIGNDGDFSLGLVHRRLSIIELSKAGHQPMCNEDKTIWIVYNGEIYNHPDIRDRLKAKGYEFRSNSDTEVVIHAYEEWGVDCLYELRGMFAFGIFDKKNETIFLAVDRFGIKPLYFFNDDDGPFIFSSEIRAILNSGIIEKRIESGAVESFLAYGAVQSPLTMIKGVCSLLPAHFLLYNLQTRDMQTENYWHPSDTVSEQHLGSKDDAIHKLKEILVESIEQHLVSDVPVGLFLSGGIDSSSIVAIANTQNAGALQTFSVTFSETTFSEKKYSQLIARKYCKDHIDIKMSVHDMLSILPSAMESMDQPTIDGINVYAISKAVSEKGLKVVLSGQGGDELFGGYPSFRRIPTICKLYNLIKILPVSARHFIAKTIEGRWKWHRIGTKISQIFESEGDILSLNLIMRELFSPNVRNDILFETCQADMINGVPLQVLNLLNAGMNKLDDFGKISLIEMRLYLANMLLRDGDVMSMAHGLEVRVPFLDHKLVEFVLSVSSMFKEHPKLPKPLLLNAMGDMLPKEIYMRPKMGFVFPWEIWMRNQLRSQIEELLYGFPENNAIGLNMKNCRNLWQMFLRNSSKISWAQVWAIYVLIFWYQRHVREI